ncbi:glutamine--tRNA ligase/YqeY domain fusion protein [Halodesulfovibrio sp.]|jgi:glutaminyl-tRNA synthetase|uniref:glutamine--tRNA ligase/YqeY domain fusion protein n=1 Tax=Halodesulfovibrio sp. TaxID=1912772 RepID=UPI0025D1FDDF|nr:glutamine--tRNA ligase/YqeY domain fusion protein [Halodesulfovibrio sp.]MCT4626454.1 glutamine--tRNA ligase/YqeY domain fusion protein [Halodesulfovibrio sp.]
MSKAPVATEENNEGTSLDFIRTIIAEDCESGKYDGRVHTRFPPEPNGYLHLGHAKSICLNFGIAQEHEGGICNLRFDDTNPLKEEDEYVRSIQEDVTWLGFDWGEKPFYTSDYFEVLFGHAVKLIEMGKAYVDHSTPEAIREMRGTLTEPGTESPYRTRSVEENLDLFNRMRNGEFADGECVLRAKIDMASPNMIMRDPALYRIRRATHHRTGDAWCIYPMYDFAHCLSDSQEHITHSICTLEFENNRELYDWLLETLGVYRPQQIEFARLNLTHTVLSKRKLIQLVEEGHVRGWDDPRMPTISGLRRRGCPPEAIREFCSRIGVAKADSMVDAAMLEFCMREKLNAVAPRLMGVVDPVKVVITNYPEDQVDEFEMPLHPELEEYGKRTVPFSRELYIERADFREEAPRKFFRLTVGKEVRLRYAYYITCTDVVKDENGEITEIHCTYDPETKGGWSEDGRKVKGTLHWVSVKHAVPAEVRLYEPLFEKENPNKVEEGKTFIDYINPDSEKIITAYLEPRLAECKAGERVQFERLGYYCADLDTTTEKPVFNRTATLRDSWKRVERNQK